MGDRAVPGAERVIRYRDDLCRCRHLTCGRGFPDATTGWVGPVRDPAGAEFVLKVAWADDAERNEARDEAEGLRVLAQSTRAVPAVHEAFRDGPISVLLMERIRPGFTLAASHLPPLDEDEVVAALLRALWIDPPDEGPFRPLAQMCSWWADEAAMRLRTDPGGLPATAISRGLDLFRSLPLSWTGRPRLLTTDFHHLNVLAAASEPTTDPAQWRAIDLKPYVGDPHYDVTQHILNFPDRLTTDPVGFAARMAQLTGLDPVRTQEWLFARCVQECGVIEGTAEAALLLAAAL